MEYALENWKGTWRNQYDSTRVIADDTNGVIRDVFKTALSDSSFFGLEVAVRGARRCHRLFVYSARESRMIRMNL